MAFHITSSFVTTSLLPLSLFLTKVLQEDWALPGMTADASRENQSKQLSYRWSDTNNLLETHSISRPETIGCFLCCSHSQEMLINSVCLTLLQPLKKVNQRSKTNSPWRPSNDRKIASHALKIKTVTIFNPFNWKMSSSKIFTSKTWNVNLRKPKCTAWKCASDNITAHLWKAFIIPAMLDVNSVK